MKPATPPLLDLERLLLDDEWDEIDADALPEYRAALRYCGSHGRLCSLQTQFDGVCFARQLRVRNA